MKGLKQEMEVLLNLNDSGYESSTARDRIRGCKEEQRNFDITCHSGCDVMRKLKELLEKYKDALRTDLDKQYSEKNRIEKRIEQTREERKGWGITGIGSTVGCFIPGLNIIAAPLLITSVAAGSNAKDELEKLERNLEICKDGISRDDKYLRIVNQIINNNDLGSIYTV